MSSNNPDALIVGAGLAGICAAINMLKAGLTDFMIVEKSPGVGGTWRHNTYPGCACDVVSMMYSYSFAPNPHWRRMYSGQEEIQEYVEDIFDRFSLGDYCRFNTEAVSYRFLEDELRWEVVLADGSVLYPRVVVAAVGALHKPAIPAITNTAHFSGEVFHSAQWEKSFDPAGKRIAVVGTGASAVQLIPKLAEVAGHLYVVQRTPQWVLLKPNREISRLERAIFRLWPSAQRLYRFLAYWSHELAIVAFMHPKLLKIAEVASLRHLRNQVPNPDLRARLTPNYVIGCKRILLSSDYYPVFSRSSVELIDSAPACFESDGLKTADGRHCAVDAVIFATGFATENRLQDEKIVGRAGLTIQDAWREGMHAHLGTTIPGFPNFFLMMGPNSGGGSQSILFVIEAQANYITQCLLMMRDHASQALEIKASVEAEFNRKIHARLSRSVWNTGGCDSWFLDRSGTNRQSWPGSSVTYWLRTRRPNPQSFEFSKSDLRDDGVAPSAGATSEQPLAATSLSPALKTEVE